MADPAVRIEGRRELDRALKRLQPEVRKQLRKSERTIVARGAADARSRAPRRTGAYARSIRPYVTAKGAGIASSHPGAGVIHFGGTIRPRGVPITFEPRPVISEWVDRNTDRIIDEFGDAFDAAARDAGFK